jgi:hypothetical protein
MFLPEKVLKNARKFTGVFASSTFFICTGSAAFAQPLQTGSPIPGGGDLGQPNPGARFSAPTPGGYPGRVGAPVPTNYPQGPGQAMSEYQKLPLSASAASARLEEMRNLMHTMPPKQFQDAISDYCQWLSDIADAHWRIAQSFGKVDSLRAQAETERQACFKFGQLKRQAMLIKAEFLIRQKRYPEAVSPLIDIVVAEPKTENGQNAYGLLKEIGFSEDPRARSASNPAPEYVEEQMETVIVESAPAPVATAPKPAKPAAKSGGSAPVPGAPTKQAQSPGKAAR